MTKFVSIAVDGERKVYVALDDGQNVWWGEPRQWHEAGARRGSRAQPDSIEWKPLTPTIPTKVVSIAVDEKQGVYVAVDDGGFVWSGEPRRGSPGQPDSIEWKPLTPKEGGR